MYIKRILRVLIPGVTVSVSDTRIPMSFVSRVPVSGDLVPYQQEEADNGGFKTSCNIIRILEIIIASIKISRTFTSSSLFLLPLQKHLGRRLPMYTIQTNQGFLAFVQSTYHMDDIP